MSSLFFSEYASAVRMHTATVTGMTGVAPVGPAPLSHLYEPKLYSGGVHTYCDPADYTLFHLADGGLLDVGDDVFYCITTIHARLAAGGTITLDVRDRTVDTEYVRVLDGAAAVNAYFSFAPTLLVVPANLVKIVTNRAGTVDVYCARMDWHR
jgi:hypothetical protein